jgi:hypothetical protein
MNVTYLWLIEMIGRNWESNLGQQLGHTRSITHMPVDNIRTIQIFQPRDQLDRPKTSDGIQPARSRSKQITKHPIVGCETVDESASDD